MQHKKKEKKGTLSFGSVGAKQRCGTVCRLGEGFAVLYMASNKQDEGVEKCVRGAGGVC